MTLDIIRNMIQQMIAAGQKPQTIILSFNDAEKLGIPRWTRQLLGLKVVIAYNIEETKVVPHIYDTVYMKLADEETKMVKNPFSIM